MRPSRRESASIRISLLKLFPHFQRKPPGRNRLPHGILRTQKMFRNLVSAFRRLLARSSGGSAALRSSCGGHLLELGELLFPGPRWLPANAVIIHKSAHTLKAIVAANIRVVGPASVSSVSPVLWIQWGVEGKFEIVHSDVFPSACRACQANCRSILGSVILSPHFVFCEMRKSPKCPRFSPHSSANGAAHSSHLSGYAKIPDQEKTDSSSTKSRRSIFTQIAVPGDGVQPFFARDKSRHDSAVHGPHLTC